MTHSLPAVHHLTSGGTRWKLMNSERNGSHVLDGKYALRALMSVFGTLADFDRTPLFSISGQSGHRPDGAKCPLWV
jgi:hypothetical protein